MGLEVQVIAVFRLPDAEVFSIEQECINLKIIQLVQQNHLTFFKSILTASQF
jgi:hypothetical protein